MLGQQVIRHLMNKAIQKYIQKNSNEKTTESETVHELSVFFIALYVTACSMFQSSDIRWSFTLFYFLFTRVNMNLAVMP